jgi:ABC-type multidrug transport system ATPase subunit
MEAPLVIEVRELTKRHGDRLAVHDLSFAVRPGVVTGFLRPNASGKSTTTRMITGLDPEGIRWFGPTTEFITSPHEIGPTR